MPPVFALQPTPCAAQRDVPGLTRAALPVITNVDWMRGVKVLEF